MTTPRTRSLLTLVHASREIEATPERPDLATMVRSMLSWWRKVLLMVAGAFALVSGLFAFVLRAWWRWPAATAAVVAAAGIGYFAATFSHRSALVRAVTTGPEKITRIRLQPTKARDALTNESTAFDWQVLVEIDGRPLRGYHALPQSLELAFIAELLALDPDLWIETVAADGSVHRVKKSGAQLALL